MRGKLFLLYFLSCVQVMAQQSNVTGVVSIFNSETRTGKRQYVSNAQVEDEFNKAQPVITNTNGHFKLIYVGINEQTLVTFQVKKPGLQVVNTDALSAVAGQNDLVKISMAHPDSIAEYRRKIYNVGKTEAEKYLENLVRKKNKELTDLRKNSLQNKNKINELEQELSQIEVQRRKIEEQARDLAKRYTPVNLDDASSLFREAFELFQKGNLDSAQLLLKLANLPGKVDSILLEEKKIEQGKKEFNERDSLKNQRKKEYGEGLQLKADLHKTRYEFDSTSECYELLIKLDSLNTDYLFNYARFLQWLNLHDKAMNYYLKVLKTYRENSKVNPQTYERDVARTQHNLGILYRHKNDYVKAEAALLEALEIRKRLAKVNPQTYETEVAGTQNTLGVLYRAKNDFFKAEGAFMEALEVYQRLAKVNPQTYEPDIALLQNNLGILYRAKNDFLKAEAAYGEALKIRKVLASANPQTYEPDVATTQNDLGDLYYDRNDYAKAEAAYLEALRIRKQLVKSNPQTHEPYVAETQNNLGALYSDKNDYVKAEAAYLEALEIARRFAKANPQTYESDVAATQNNLGNLYLAKDDYTKAETAYQEALEVYKRLARANPQTYEPVVAIIQHNLGIPYHYGKNYVKAEAAYRQALEIRKRLAKANPQTFEPDLAGTQYALGNLYLITKNYIQAEIFLVASLITRAKWMDKDPEIYTKKVSETANDLLDLYTAILDTLKYDAFRKPKQDSFEIVENILTNQSKKDLEVAHKLSGYYGSRSWYLLFASKFKEAEQAAKKGLAIDSAFTLIKKNLAHALLFEGKYEDALTMYQELDLLKNEVGKSYTAIYLDDLDELEKNGIANSDVNKIRAVSNK